MAFHLTRPSNVITFTLVSCLTFTPEFLLDGGWLVDSCAWLCVTVAGVLMTKWYLRLLVGMNPPQDNKATQ